MSRERSYNEYIPYDRPKMPRNKYLKVYDSSSVAGSSLFGSSDTANQIGVEMIDIKDFSGATFEENGVRGLVPAPMAGQQTYFLQGTGAFTKIPAYEWMSEFPTGDGLAKSGLQVNGNLNVTDTLSTMNLDVQGAAHFWSLLIDQVKANGGQMIISPSMFHIDFVGQIQYYPIFTIDSPLYTLLSKRIDISAILNANNAVQVKCRRVYQRNDDGNKKISNECYIGDMMRCRSWNIQPVAYSNVENKDYWTFVVNTGEETYVDEDGKSYPCFFIDLAYSFIKSDKKNIPIGSLLNIDGTFEYPDNYDEWTFDEISELKRVSQQTLDGTQNIDVEYLDPYEYKEVKDTVIKVRGLDDVISRISSLSVDNSLTDYSSLNYIEGIIGDISGGNNQPSLSPLQMSGKILTGEYPDYTGTTTDSEEQEALRQTQAIEENLTVNDADASITVNRVKKNTMCLAAGTNMERSFILDSKEISATVDGTPTVFHKGDTIPSGAIINDDAFVIDNNDSLTYKKHNPDISDPTPAQESDISQSDLDQIEHGTPNTSTGLKRAENNNRNYEDVTEWLFGYGVFDATPGDDLACLGHLFTQDRQNAIVLSSIAPIDPELQAPAIAQYNKIDTFGENISQYRLTSIAANGNEFLGSFLVNNDGKYIDVNDKINLFIRDLESGLESVGIHLNGENSSITMVGNVDIRQHSEENYDSLNVYDKYNTKRVEILPFDIPARGSAGSQITSSKMYTPYTNNSFTAPKSYITEDYWKDWSAPGLFYYYAVYDYTLRNYIARMTVTKDIGQYSNNCTLDFSKLNLEFDCYPYLIDQYSASETSINITTLEYTIKRNGVAVQGYSGVSIKDIVSVKRGNGGRQVVITYNDIFIPSFLTQAGSYTIEYNIGVNISAFRRYYNNSIGNYYFKLYTQFFGDFTLIADTSNLTGDDDVSGKKMTIGTNGFVFKSSNTRHFYAASDGYEIKWDNTGLSFDSATGFKVNKRYYTVAQLKNTVDPATGQYIYREGGASNGKIIIPTDADIIHNTDTAGTRTTLYLKNTVDVGTGREMVIIDNNLEVSESSASVIYPLNILNYETRNNTIPDKGYVAKTQIIRYWNDYSEGEWTSSTVYNGVRRIMWTNNKWYEV